MAAFSWLLIFSLAMCFEDVSACKESLDEVIDKLANQVADSQVKKETKFDPPFSYYKQPGVYPSDIRFNFNGFVEANLLRDGIAFFDDNAFVTLWTTIILLETQKFSKPPPAPSEDQLQLALRAISAYHDKNRPSEDSVLVFWPQAYNASTDTWVCGPVNLKGVAHSYKNMLDFATTVFDELGLGHLWDKYAVVLYGLYNAIQTFKIPADFDDTFVNIGLGFLLMEQHFSFPNAYVEWTLNNTKLESAFDALKTFSYRPFQQELDSSLIDPRTFFYLRDFLYTYEDEGDIALPATWAENLTMQKTLFYKGVVMPFNINNVDLAVTANVIYGLTAAVLAELKYPSKSWFDEDLQKIYLNSTNMIAYQIAHNLSSRPDLALTYYPSVYNFYWFVSRTANLLNSAQSLPFPVMTTVRDTLNEALRGPATKAVLSAAQKENDTLYFDEFLGDADFDLEGKPVRRGDDRIMVTSMVVNILCYTWSVGGKLIDTTPQEVLATIRGAAEWLLQYALSGRYKPYNVFFSGSVKDLRAIPFFFPTNYGKFLNGTDLPPNLKPSYGRSDVVLGVKGVIPSAEYVQLLKVPHRGRFTPMDFHGYNGGPHFLLPFWSSQPLTHASTLLALAQYRHYFPQKQRDRCKPM